MKQSGLYSIAAAFVFALALGACPTQARAPGDGPPTAVPPRLAAPTPPPTSLAPAPPASSTPAAGPPVPAPVIQTPGHRLVESFVAWLDQFDFAGVLLNGGTSAIHLLAASAATILIMLSSQPVLAFWRRGWHIKRQDVMSSLDERSKALYLQTFQDISPSDPSAAFDKLYRFRYGRHRLIPPYIILVLISFPLLFLLSETALAHLLFRADGHWGSLGAHYGGVVKYPQSAAASIAGAYTWVVVVFISGATHYDLPPGVILTGALRLAIAAPLGYAVAALAGPHFGPFIAFALGAFPLDVIQLLFRRSLNKLGLEIGTSEDQSQVKNLDGVDQIVADRLASADISTIAQLAYCDPVQVSMRTNINFDAIIDAQNQALAWVYFGPALEKIRPMGMRGAMEIANLLSDVRSPDPARCGPATETFNDIATALAMPNGGLIRAFIEIGDDPYTEFLSKIWSNTADDEAAARAMRRAIH